MARVIFAVEHYRDAIPGMRLLYDEHWAEVALDKDAIKLDPDYEKYLALADHGLIHCVTARLEDGSLIGYYLAIVYAHLHYRTSITAFTDIFYLAKERRDGWTGYRLLKTARDTLKARGVQRIVLPMKNHINFESILTRLGFKWIERVYTMTFKDQS